LHYVILEHLSCRLCIIWFTTHFTQSTLFKFEPVSWITSIERSILEHYICKKNNVYLFSKTINTHIYIVLSAYNIEVYQRFCLMHGPLVTSSNWKQKNMPCVFRSVAMHYFSNQGWWHWRIFLLLCRFFCMLSFW
jgi:hypothetical protein